MWVASDGWPFLIVVLVALTVAVVVSWWWLAAALLMPLILLVLLFRDPPRSVPANPHAVLSPVDGRVVAVERVDEGIMARPALRVALRVNNLGAYAARSPIEGKVMELTDKRRSATGEARRARGLWVRGDGGDDVVLLIHGFPLLGHARAFIGYGERIGQGQPAAWLRIAREAEVFLPADARACVAPGDRVRAGDSVLAEFAHDGPPGD